VPPLARAVSGPPTPEPNFAGQVAPQPCTPEPGDLSPGYDANAWYGSSCQRLTFAYGPLHIRPGQDDVVVSPITIEKPAYDGYVVRFRPDLKRADGTTPPIEQIHLHHAVWFGLPGEAGYNGPPIGAGPAQLDMRDYGEGPFWASGEEKTFFDAPQGYGMPVKATDNWQLLYMVHNQTPQPDNVWITYTVDYVTAGTPAAAGIHPTYPVWLDVQRGQFYPVFNVQRGFPAAGSSSCTWPDDKCAAFGPFGAGQAPTVGQGNPGVGDRAGPGDPWAYQLPAAGRPFGRIANWQGGTLVGIGGHLHPGGLSDNVDLIRGADRTRIFTSEAHYWPRADGSAPPDSWDLSMGVTWKPRWAVRVNPGDTLRISATYDTTVQSTYEDMGIAIAMLAPDDQSGLDPFAAPHDTSEECTSGGLTAGVVCEKGFVTHGHLAEASDYGGPDGHAIAGPPGPQVSNIAISGFSYLPGNQGTESATGIPQVKAATGVTFDNFDASADIYHSVTACAEPCNGGTGIAYPLSNATAGGNPLDYDSNTLGYGPRFGNNGIGAAANKGSWTLSTAGIAPGTVLTYFCRIHPFMRGQLEVVQ
jgi:hypothetical protein